MSSVLFDFFCKFFGFFALFLFARVYLAHMRHFAGSAVQKGTTKGSAGERKKKTALPV
jgi:hypothetical protein